MACLLIIIVLYIQHLLDLLLLIRVVHQHAATLLSQMVLTRETTQLCTSVNLMLMV